MNKKTVITGFILTIIIIGVILAIYFGTRKTNDPEKEPIISISSAELVAQSETETYKMMTEYYDLPELSKGVEIKTTINVKDSYLIKTLKITRTNGSNVDEQNVPISDGDKTISFKPKPNENMAVSHTIKVTYTTLVSDTVKDGPSATIAISEDQLSLASTSKSGDISLTVGNPSLSNNVLFTKNYVTIKLGSIDIFPSQQIYFSPASGNGFKIMGASGNSLNVVNGKIFYILAAGNKNMIATTATETTATEYLTYTNNTLSLSIKTINFQNKLFDITFGSAVPAPPSSTPTPPPSSTPTPPPSSTPTPPPAVAQCANFVRIKSRYGYYLKDMGDGELRSDKRSDIPGIGEWKFEGSFPDDVRIKAPNGQYLVDLGDAHVRLEWQNWKTGVNGWKILGNDFTNLNIKSPTNKYLAMNSNGAIYLHGNQIPDANAWKIECY